jgi:hypothetical protein
LKLRFPIFLNYCRHMRFVQALFVAAASVFVLGISSVTAQANASEERYRALIREALDAYERHNMDEAKLLFEQAHQVQPNARTLRGIGLVAFAMNDYVRAVRHLDAALDSGVKPLEGELESQTRALADRARKLVGTVHIDVEPGNARLSIDGGRVELSVDRTVQLNPGPHELVAEAPGHETATRQLRAEAGVRIAVQLRLAPDRLVRSASPSLPPSAAAAQPEVAAAVPVATPDSGSGSSVGPFVLLGISGAAVVGGGVLLALAMSDKAAIEGAELGTHWPAVSSGYDSVPAMSGAGIALVAAGAAGVVGGLVWHFARSESDAPREQQLSLHLSPFALQARGRW